jgi:type 1 glutamine amidotransferase
LSHISVADISADEREKIQNAVPKKSMAQPAEARKLLITTLNVKEGHPGYGHKSLPHGVLAFQLMGEQTGAYDVVVSNDTLMFTAENLKQFDAICFLNTAGIPWTDPTLRMNLLDFVSQGGGFIGIHAAGATFVQWPEYWQFPAFGQMLGAYEDGGHPWAPDETITLKVEEPDHPLTSMFENVNFDIQDEVFQFRAPYSRDALRILLTIDTDKTDMNPERRFLPQRYADKDFAMSWIRQYGKGRVFYSSLGHNPHIYWNAPVLEHFLAGIQYALGDLEADATPSNQLKIKK